MSQSEQGSTGGERAQAPVCPVALCPVGMLLSVSGQLQPDAMAHLLKAGKEFMLAVSAVIGARAQSAEGSARLQKIEVE